jgi:histidine ammonia-lyase
MNQRIATIYLDGNSLSVDALMLLGTGKYKIELTESAIASVEESRRVIEELVARDDVIYGVNTGFGLFSTVKIQRDQINQLQYNLITSHSSAVGETLNLEATRRMFGARINVLAKGHSGIRPETLKQIVDAFNHDCIPLVPEQGTVGASGDLCHLSHLALGLIGQGQMWDPEEKKYNFAGDVLKKFNLSPLQLQAKEGLAMINGTQFITGVGTEAVAKANRLVKSADYIAAYTISALRGTEAAFSPEIHETRPHPGQILSATHIRLLMHNANGFKSEIREKYKVAVQDAYSMRCAPQVHGIVHDTIRFVTSIFTTELNSATDNPMIFAKQEKIISGGNFHGEYPAKALDYLSIATHELGSISERRIERLMNHTLNGGLPWFLVQNGGMNSGFMISHCTAASLVAENRALCHPASVDSISTSASKEDHVSMGGWAARKAVKIAKNAEYILAIELMCSTQAFDFLRPEKTTPPLEALYDLVRKHVKPLENDRVLSSDIETIVGLIRDGSVVETIERVLHDHAIDIPEMNKTITSEQQTPIAVKQTIIEPFVAPARSFDSIYLFAAGFLAGVIGYSMLTSKKSS